MDVKLEAIVIPVSDVDRSIKFYQDQLGWRLDIDYRADTYEKALGFRFRGEPSYRIVQLTPPGSECSIQFGQGVTRVRPGAYQGMYLVTNDIEATRAELLRRHVDVSDPFHFGPNGQTPGLEAERQSYNSFATFADPDGNCWIIQEIKKRLPGR